MGPLLLFHSGKGGVVSAQGVKPNPRKIEAILKYPEPKYYKGIRQLLGIGSYYRRFIKDHAPRAQPLQKLISQDVEFV